MERGSDHGGPLPRTAPLPEPRVPYHPGMTFAARALREPLVPFFAVGAFLFALDRATPPAPELDHQITLDDAFVRGLTEEATRRTGHVPDAAQTESLVGAWVREEVLFREARALGLDQDDLVVRRRLVQKIELLLAAEARWEPPTDTDLAEYLAAHHETFGQGALSSLALCYFSREHGRADERALEALQAPGAMRCDPHLRGDRFEARTDALLAASLGTEIAAAVAAAPLGEWTGPIETSRGVYILRVDAREPARDAALEEVRPAVVGAVLEERRASAVEMREREMADRYVVERAR